MGAGRRASARIVLVGAPIRSAPVPAGRVSLEQVSDDGLAAPPGIGQAPMYYLALCAADPACLPEVDGGLWLFDDLEESVYRHYQGEIRRNMAAGRAATGC